MLVRDGNYYLAEGYHCPYCHKTHSINNKPEKGRVEPVKCATCGNDPSRFPSYFDPTETNCNFCKLAWEILKDKPGIQARRSGRPSGTYKRKVS